MDVHLTGTGYWRYTLGVSGQPRPFQPHIRNLLAAQSGQTTVLRPVGTAIMGVDIDIANQLMLGDSTGLLTMDLSDADPGGVVTLEIHSDGLDIVSDGAQVAVTNIEHELGGAGPGKEQAVPRTARRRHPGSGGAGS